MPCDRIMLGAFLGEQRRVSVDLVNQISAEMRDEQVTPAALQTDAFAARPAAVVEAPTSPESTCSACWPTRGCQGAGRAGAAFDTARFEERLAVLERTLSTLNALGQLLKSAQQQATTTENGGQGK